MDGIGRRGLRVGSWILAALLLAALSAPAADAHEQSAARKLGRGLAAITCGFLEIPGNMTQLTRERGPAVGLPLGFAQGLGKLVVRELVGVYEVVTSWFPVPARFEPILEPEFPWGYFEAPRH